MRKYSATLFVILFLFAIELAAQTPKVFATTDSAEYFVGDYIEYQLQLSYDKDTEVLVPAIQDSVTALEFIKELPTEKNEVNGKINEIRKYVFSKYDSAEVMFPPLPIDYRKKGEEKFRQIKTNPVVILVRTMDVNPNDDIRDIKQPITVPFDFLFWGLILLGAALLALIGWFVYQKYFMKEKAKEKKKIKVYVPPHKVAISELRQLENEKLWQQGKVKEYHFRITYIVRKYFGGRFGFDALEMPSSEVLDKLKEISEAGIIFDLTKNFFENADLVKYAKFEPMPSVNDEMMKQAYEIVNKTKKEEEPEKAEESEDV